MNKWIDFTIRHPKIIVTTVILATIASFLGMARIEFDSSTEALMPRYDWAYKLGEKVRHEFADTKTFITVSLAPANTSEDTEKKILSADFFNPLREMVNELQSYKEFDAGVENANLQAFLNITKISRTENANSIVKANSEKALSSVSNSSEEGDLDAQFLSTDKKEKPETNKPEISDNKTKVANTTPNAPEEELDAQFLNVGNSKPKPANSSTNDATISSNVADSFWDNTKEVPQIQAADYDDKIQAIGKLDYSAYEPVALDKITNALDKNGLRHLQTILDFHKIVLDNNSPITKSQIRKIAETWLLLYNYRSTEIIKSMIDPITLEDLVGSATELKPEGLLKKINGERQIPANEKEFSAYKKRLQKTESFENSVYARDNQGNLRALGMNIMLKPLHNHQQITDIIWTIINKYDKKPFEVFVMGNLLFNKFMNEFNQNDLKVFLPLVIVIIILTFYLNFRSLRGTILPTITVVVATIWTMGLHGLFGIKLTIIGTILPPLLIAVGSSYSIHIFNQYLLERSANHPHGYKNVLVSSLHHIITTVVLAGFTTIVGFSTLSVNKITALKSFGIFAAIGTFFAVIISVSLIPAALYLMKEEKIRPQKGSQNSNDTKSEFPILDMIRRGTINLVTHHAGKVLLGTLIVISLGIWGTSKMTTNTAPTAYFLDGSYVKNASARIGELFKGDLIMNIVFDSGKPYGAYDPAFLNYVEQIRAHLKQQKISDDYNIMHTTTFSDFVKRMHMAMNEDKKEFYAIPREQKVIREYMEIFSGEDRDSDGRADAFEISVDKKFQRVNLMLKMGENKYRNFSTDVSRKAKAYLESYIPTIPNENKYRWAIVGQPLNFVILGDLITTGQIQSIILCTLIVGFIVFLLFKNLLAGLVALVPISTAVIIIFGGMGFMSIPLDIAQAILSSIAIGIGVDDTIHFLNSMRVRLKTGMSIDEALIATIDEAGIAIIYTSIALIFGFSILMLSSFNPVFNFGFLVSTVMIATTVGALLVLPSTIKYFNIRLDIEKNWRIFRYLDLKKILGDH